MSCTNTGDAKSIVRRRTSSSCPSASVRGSFASSSRSPAFAPSTSKLSIGIVAPRMHANAAARSAPGDSEYTPRIGVDARLA
eukprot:CAMPEP_0179721674 /NCGR_PEP_ID=MMETSP0938-20121108/4603_1 /TAXON_ID=548131 ORGANISM="Ostreococcus mediterraneus, Strain clade-D-RCC1107" /NCGR_SAMPLE_ID=MMETSP0938 /ASSEMBLY_ACC=CAM_ASM_000576 /LENGTH=81 /DNA_ID=CAMNT_0021595629 /DNA_START=462 /DNA_END=703 /DNA_ORIENTATION=-